MHQVDVEISESYTYQIIHGLNKLHTLLEVCNVSPCKSLQCHECIRAGFPVILFGQIDANLSKQLVQIPLVHNLRRFETRFKLNKMHKSLRIICASGGSGFCTAIGSKRIAGRETVVTL